MFKNVYVKNILSAAAIALFGAVLLNLAFLLDYGFQSLIDLLFPKNYNAVVVWYPYAKHALFCVLIALLSWLIFRSKLGDIYKATFSTVPVAAALVTVGIFLYAWPIAYYVVGGLIYVGVIAYLYFTKRSWLYYYSTTIVTVTLFIMKIMGRDI
jgi:hypothetical protein